MLPPGLSMRSTTAAKSSSLPRVAQELRQGIAADDARRVLAVQDLARSDDDADLFAAMPAERLFGAHVRQVALPVDRGETGVLVLTRDLGDDLLEFLAGLQAVDQPARQRVLGEVAAGRAHAVRGFVRVGLDQRGIEVARRADVRLVRVPERADPDARVFAILGRHVGARPFLGRRLVAAGP